MSNHETAQKIRKIGETQWGGGNVFDGVMQQLRALADELDPQYKLDDWVLYRDGDNGCVGSVRAVDSDGYVEITPLKQNTDEFWVPPDVIEPLGFDPAEVIDQYRKGELVERD